LQSFPNKTIKEENFLYTPSEDTRNIVSRPVVWIQRKRYLTTLFFSDSVGGFLYLNVFGIGVFVAARKKG